MNYQLCLLICCLPANVAYFISQKLTGSDSSENSNTGYATAIYDSSVFVGTYGSDSGYIFTRIDEAWSQTALLKAVSNGEETSTGFPSAVGLYDGVAVAGARGAQILGMDSAGAAFVFVGAADAWTQTAILVPEDQGPFDQFGYSVDIYEDKIVAGSYGAQSPESGSGEGAGAVYLFSGSGAQWSQYAKLYASDGQSEECFGCSISIYEQLIAVGAYYASKSYVFAFNYSHPEEPWTQLAVLATAGLEDLGESLSLFEGVLAAGAPLANAAEVFTAGAVYTYAPSTPGGSDWTQLAQLTATDPQYEGRFGSAVSLRGVEMAVGSYGVTDPTNSEVVQGAVYVYVASAGEWSESTRLYPLDTSVSSNMGFSVGLFNSTIAAGAPTDEDTGAVYMYFESSQSAPPTMAPTSTNDKSGTDDDDDDDLFSGSDGSIWIALICAGGVAVIGVLVAVWWFSKGAKDEERWAKEDSTLSNPIYS